MKKINRFVFLFSLSAIVLSSGTTTVLSQNKVDEKRNIKNPPSLLVLDESQSYSLQNSSQLFQDVLAPASEISFSTLKQEQDNLGFTHQKLQQFYNGIKVEFGTVILHSQNGTIKSLSSEFYPIKAEFNTSPSLTNIQAFNKALHHIGAQHYMWEYPEAAKEMDNYTKPTGELVILPDYNSGRDVSDINEFKLAYKFDMFATSPMSRGELYIDANTGEALFYNAIIKHASTFGHIGTQPIIVETEEAYCERIANEDFLAVVSGTAATRYSGSQTIETTLSGGNYILSDAGRKVYTRDALNQAPGNTYPYVNNYQQFTDNDNNWTTAEHSTNKDNAALDAHWGAMKTYDYWQQKHSRNSYDGNGAQIRSYVHVDNNYDNAFWNGAVMSYGDGSSNGNEGNGFFDALTSIDVAAHEIGHAVTSFTANLAYQRESGGLNEGFSDIWGAAVEHFSKGNGNDANPLSVVWLIGDEIDRRSGSAALRSMSNPTSLGQPDTYGGQYWQNPNCGTPTQSNDYCGVHTNSGVLNYWFYLTVVGGNGSNDIGNSFNVAGIGMTKASAISYRTLNNYLTSNSTFANARTGSIQAAIDLYGAGGAEEQAVTNAWHAVGVGAAYGGGGGSNYCASASTNVNDEYISRVQLGTINNASGAQFYSDFTNISTTLNEGQAYTITVTPTWTGTVYAEGYAVWIDYNNDKDFSDAGELVWSKAASTNTPNSGTFTVPTGTAGTATRMRVSMKYNGIPTACESFTYGEVEDYTVNLSGSTADTQAPSVPANLAASNVTQTTVDLSWNASTDNVGVTGYDVYQGTTNLGTVSGTSTQITGLTASTAYSFRVRARDAAGNISGYSNTVNVTTSAAPDTQAPSVPTSLVASNVTQTTVDLSWNASTDNVGVTGYDVYQGNTNLGTVAGTTTQITGLTASTAYSFRVRARDAAGNISGYSNTVNVTTTSGGGGSGCAGGISSFPYTESFESSIGAWTQSSADDIDWTRDSNGTPSSNTGPSSGAAGSWYMYVEASSPNYPSKRAILNSPCLNLTAASSANFTFSYHMYGATDMGSIALEASSNNGSTWTTLWSKTGNQGNAWLSQSVDLSAYVGGSVQVRFNRVTGSTWQADIAIDNISVTTGGGGGTPPTGYCSSNGNNTSDEYIQRVQLGSINNASGASPGGYGDYTSLSTNLNSSNTITITPAWTGTVYSEGYAVWIDYNRDGDFGDAGELVYSRTATTATPVSGTFTVPGGASAGPTRMRVSMKYNGVPTSCESFTYGEVEDYIVNIGGSNPLNNGIVGGGSNTILGGDVTASDFRIYPNPVRGNVLNVDVLQGNATDYLIYNLVGQVVAKGNFTNTVDVSSLKAGVYLIQVNAGDEKFVERFIKE